MIVNWEEQSKLAQRLYAADPLRPLDPNTCWVAACMGAYELLEGKYSALRFKVFVDHYGLENVE